MGYHGCDRSVGEDLIKGKDFKPSTNSWDWLGAGIYFWEANPARGLEFANEQAKRNKTRKQFKPWVIGSAIDLGHCLDLTTKAGVEHLKIAYKAFVDVVNKAGYELPKNQEDGRNNLDCAVINYLHIMRESEGQFPFDTVKGAFIEGEPIYDNSRFMGKTHIQISVRNPKCIKGIFRVKEFP